MDLVKPQPRSGLGGWALNRLRQIRDNHLDLLKYFNATAWEITNHLKKPCAVLPAGAVVNINTRCIKVLALWKSPKSSHKRQIHHTPFSSWLMLRFDEDSTV